MSRKRVAETFLIFTILMATGLIFPLQCVKASEAVEETVTLKVGFPETPGYSMTDGNGNRSGIFYDFLMEIAKYTGWKYEFIEGTPDEMIERLGTGEVDIMGGIYYREELLRYYCYSDYNMGRNHSLILSKKNDDSIKIYDPRTMNGKTIGVFSRAENKVERLKDYLDYVGLDCRLVYYDTAEAYDRCVELGETDMILSNDIYRKDKYQVVGKFEGEYSYIVLSMQKSAAVGELNEAMRRIYEANAEYAEELYIKYFPSDNVQSITLDREEQAFIQKSGAVRVAVIKERYPFYYRYQNEDKGIAKDTLDLISERTGIRFEYVFGDSYEDTLRLVKEGKAEMTAHFIDGERTADEENLIITKPYIMLDDVTVKNRRIDRISDEMTAAVLKGRGAPEHAPVRNVIYGATIEDCIRMVNDGEADYTSMPALVAEYVLGERNYPNALFYAMNKSRAPVSFGLSRNAPTELYSIMSKAVNSIADEETAHILLMNRLSPRDNPFSLRTFIYNNPGTAILVCAVVIMLISAVFLVSLRSHMKNELMRGRLRQAEDTSRAKSEFLSRMSHELRTPMNAIIGLTKLIRLTDEIPAQIGEKLEKIDTSSRYLLTLLNDILDMSKIESNKMSILEKPFSLEKIVSNLKIMMDMQAEERRITFECRLEAEDSFYMGDELRIRQVLMNLLSNAFKYTKAGGNVTLSVEETKKEGKTASLYFRVTDTGVGIKKENCEKVFEAFEQVSEGEERIKGTGLGLSISSNMVRLMGGKLELVSEPGVGTEFFFTLKLPLAEATEVEAQPKEEAELEFLTDQKLEGMRLLLAEDNELNAEITVALLEARKIVVEHAKDGEQALRMFLEHRAGYYDAVLMDIQMPVMNGLAATQRIRASGKEDAQKIPIIAMTANTFREDREQAMEAGMNDFIPKPFEIGELYRAFQKIQKKEEKGE